MVTLVIDNKTVCVPEGTSILDAARTASIDIPTLCYLKDLNEIGACRICMVEVEVRTRSLPHATMKCRKVWSSTRIRRRCV